MEWQSAKTKENSALEIPDRWLLLHYYEALNILFRMENALRVFVYVILKDAHKEQWTDIALTVGEAEQSTIAAASAKRMSQAKGFGYLGYDINSPLMYLSSGELTHLIMSDRYWPIFKPYFRAKKEIVRNKFDEISSVRNSLAHFRPLKSDDIEMVKQNIKHVFIGIEECFSKILRTDRVVPTNTEGNWYKALFTNGSQRCEVGLFQDSSESWISLQILYRSAVLRQFKTPSYRTAMVTKLVSPAILRSYPSLSENCIFLNERIVSRWQEDGGAEVDKRISIVFSRACVEANYVEIQNSLEDLLLKIESETELIETDNLARGEVVDSGRIVANREEAGKYAWWILNVDELKCEVGGDDPPEYWGGVLEISTGDFIAGTKKYPWMPADISKDDEIPF